jgi:erythronate-4-phosphate dehydrogenase
MRLNIVADAHVWGVEQAFGSLPEYDVNLQTLEAAEISRDALAYADVLITRSSTRVGEALLSGTPVRFAATATIGDDHYDKHWLTARGIGFANAAGSSTGSVIEYMLATLLELHARNLVELPHCRLGIIGVGRIGGALAGICGPLGIPTLLNDPPRARSEGKNGFFGLDELLDGADVLSLHTPLHRSGRDRTLHLIGREEMQRFKGRGIINAGRGPCLDNIALLDWLDGDKERFAVLDCWENEPSISSALLGHRQLAIGTPHIAGHSLDGKAANTLYARRALCRWLGVNEDWQMDTLLPTVPQPIAIPFSGDAWQNLHAAAIRLYDINADDAALRRAGKNPEGIGKAFTSLRRHYPVRRSWNRMPVHFLDPDPATLKLARAMGIKVI